MSQWYMKCIGKNKIADAVFRKLTTYSITVNLLLKKCGGGGTTYIICRPHPAGFFSDFFFVLGHLSIANRLGFIPVVDMKHYPSLYSENESIFDTNNSWEYYFLPVSDIDIDEVIKGKCNICEEKYPYGIVPYYSTTNLLREGKPSKRMVKRLNKVINKFVHIRPELIDEFNSEINRSNIANALGVHIRGTDMKNTVGHNVPADVNIFLEKIKAIVKEQGFKTIFLCTDEKRIQELVFGAMNDIQINVITTEAYRSNGRHEGLHLEKIPSVSRRYHKYLLGKEVLKDAYLLSKCKSLVCGYSNVAYAAIVLNNNHYKTISYII